MIRAPHLQAARELVAYSCQTVDWLIGAATANTPRSRILAAVELSGEMTKTEGSTVMRR